MADWHPGEMLYLFHWRFPDGEEFGLYRERGDADQACAGKSGSEVISLPVLPMWKCQECRDTGIVYVDTDCGGCSGYPGIQHEPACGVEPCPRGCEVPIPSEERS
jgi:hypothetical protein